MRLEKHFVPCRKKKAVETRIRKMKEREKPRICISRWADIQGGATWTSRIFGCDKEVMSGEEEEQKGPPPGRGSSWKGRGRCLAPLTILFAYFLAHRATRLMTHDGMIAPASSAEHPPTPSTFSSPLSPPLFVFASRGNFTSASLLVFLDFLLAIALVSLPTQLKCPHGFLAAWRAHTHTHMPLDVAGNARQGCHGHEQRTALDALTWLSRWLFRGKFPSFIEHRKCW